MAIGKILAEAYELKSNEIFRGDFGSGFVYRIPKFQRPYVWGKDNWRDLFDDIVENEAGYFVGAILCVHLNSERSYEEYEVIDGQQRLTTMSLFLAAIYKAIEECGIDKLDYKQGNIFNQIKAQLTLENDDKKFFLRIFPQKDQQNRDDYLYIMGSGEKEFLKLINLDEIVGVGKINHKNIGNRRLCKAYKFFKNEILKYANHVSMQDSTKKIEAIFEILNKVNSTTFVRIVAPSRDSANKLFEALNNRGVLLTVTDLIKNQLLSKFDDVSGAVGKWGEMTQIFSRDGKEIPAGDQERFFRQTYNACRHSWEKDLKLAIAKRANLYNEYEKLIDSDAEKVLTQLLESSQLYQKIQGYDTENVPAKLQSAYADLIHIKGANSSYVLLLYLLKNQTKLAITDEYLEKICSFLVSYFVRYSVTNNPPSNALERIFNGFIEEVEVGIKDKDGNSIAGPHLGGKTIFEKLSARLKKEYLAYSGGSDNFEMILRGDVYDGTGSDDNIRFVLVKLAEKHLPEKQPIDFWEKSAKLLWSIEHILPQKLDKNGSWIAELGCSNENDANAIKEQYVHKLGNLTLTKYNSELSNKSFLEKRDLKDENDVYIGYKDFLSHNGGLNSYVAQQNNWTPKQIDERTDLLVKEILEIFAW